MGYQLGKAGSLVLLGKPVQQEFKAARLMQGIAKPFSGSFTLKGFIDSDDEVEKPLLNLDKALQQATKAY